MTKQYKEVMLCYYYAVAKKTEGDVKKAHSQLGGTEMQIHLPLWIQILSLIKGDFIITQT